MLCKCNHDCKDHTSPGVIKTPDGDEIKVWFCTCGLYYEINTENAAELRTWTSLWKTLSEMNHT